MWGTLVLDKDGVSAATMLATLACYLHDKQKSLNEQLKEIYDQYGYHITSNSYYVCHDENTINAIFNRLRSYPDTVRTDKV